MTVSSRDILIVEDLVKHYPVRKGVIPRTVGQIRAVDGISFSIPRGRTLGLVGESGCGKTTAGRTILRLVEPTSGRVIFDDHDVFMLPEREMRSLRREMQIIFQDPYGSLNPRMTVGAMLQEPLLVHGARGGLVASRSSARREARDAAASLLARVGMAPESMNRYPHEFSGGQRQRVGIARALTVNPRFIVCDEAVSALDVSIQAQILNLLCDLQKERDIAYLFIAHDLSVVRHIADRVAVMYMGEIVEEADTEEMFGQPLHPYTQALLASIPAPIPQERRTRRQLEGDVPAPTNPPPGCRFHTRCPIAVEECRREKPPLVEIRPGHLVACARTEVSALSIPIDGVRTA